MKNQHVSKFITYIALCCVGVLPSFAQPTAPVGLEWRVLPELTDEFDTFDVTKWEKPTWNYVAPNRMIEDNSGVTDGKLWIKATFHNVADRWFISSRVQSKAQTKFPMYIECSMRTAHISAYIV